MSQRAAIRGAYCGDRLRRFALWVSALCALPACNENNWKVPIVDVGALFSLADAVWVEEEETLFVFYRIESLQGLSDKSQIEMKYRTDEEDIPYTPLAALSPVHEHVKVECGPLVLCGSFSLRVPLQPRYVDLRLRYHEDGEVFLTTLVQYYVVSAGADHSQRSAVIYGVFDERNERVQWRLRHQFPNLRNEEAQALGLRRWFQVEQASYGDVGFDAPFASLDNAYGYGLFAECPAEFTGLDHPPVETTERAIFQSQALPLGSSTSPHVCAHATVVDARGTYRTNALAQKNPEVRPAFAALRTPVRELKQIRYFFETCDLTVSEGHRQLQLQRMLMDESHSHCVDDFEDDNFWARISGLLRARLDEERSSGEDMALVIALQRADNNQLLPQRIAVALSEVMASEREKSSPRLAGIFVYDSDSYVGGSTGFQTTTLWCPSSFGGDDLDFISDSGVRDCGLSSELELPINDSLRISTLPVLPTRRQYETFVAKYGEQALGSMLSMELRAPTFAATSFHVDLGGYAVATFFDDETIAGGPQRVFSTCFEEASVPAVVYDFRDGSVYGLEELPFRHANDPQSEYYLGLAWDFAMYVTLEYLIPGAVEVREPLRVALPLPGAEPAEAYPGSDQWRQESFDLSPTLAVCERFCRHATFDAAGVYNARTTFEGAYAAQCYRPVYPVLGNGGFPFDP